MRQQYKENKKKAIGKMSSKRVPGAILNPGILFVIVTFLAQN